MMKKYVVMFACGHSREWTTMPALAPRPGDVCPCTRCRTKVTISNVIVREREVIIHQEHSHGT